MGHPLDGARLKIDRARHHLRSLDEGIEQYLRSTPYSFPDNRQGGMTRVRIALREQPPPILSCVVGDCVTNLRASLDYVAWELGIKFSGGGLTDPQKRHISFPIIGNAAGFDEGVKPLSETCSVPAAAIAVIRSVQPFNAGYASLEHLNLLVKSDKHRALLLCVTDMQGMCKTEVTQGHRRWPSKPGRIAIGEDYQTSGPECPEVTAPITHVEVEAEVFVAFQDQPVPRRPVPSLLSEIVECVEAIVPRFDRFFS